MRLSIVKTPAFAAGRAAAMALAVVLAGTATAQAWPDLGPARGDAGRGLIVAVETTVDQMPPGMAEAYVRGIQEELAGHGYRPGPADGKPGPRTRSAVRAYQRDAGLPVTGAPSKELLDHLKFVTPKVHARPAAVASSSELVTDVQRHLYERGYYKSAIDGLAGPATRDAVRRFQGDAGLPVTGAVDQRLLAEIKLTDPAVRAQ
jgi:peptidoglycan hydrolase-like protein with peptidoglycan-binding domain